MTRPRTVEVVIPLFTRTSRAVYVQSMSHVTRKCVAARRATVALTRSSRPAQRATIPRLDSTAAVRTTSRLGFGLPLT